jgi:hypothetical protein
MTMTDTGEWLVLPYDGSPVARATLRRAATTIGTGEHAYTGIVLAVAGVEPEALYRLLQEAGTGIAPHIVLQAQLLPPGDPLRALQRVVAGMPATLAAPVDPQGAAPWCLAAWRLGEPTCAKMVFFLTPDELRAGTTAHTAHDAPTSAWGAPACHRRREHVLGALALLGALVMATIGAFAVDLLVHSHMAASWVYLLVVLPVALRWGRALGVATAVAAAGLLLTVFVEPRFSFTVADERDIGRVALSLGGMVGAALLAQSHAAYQTDRSAHRRHR